MTFLLADAKTRLGILPGDFTRDVLLQAGLDAALALAETYCDRKFMFTAGEVETFNFPFSASLQLHRFPLDKVTSVAPTGSGALGTDSYQVAKLSGQVLSSGWFSAKQIDVTYDGGYKVLPPDLLLALWSIFDSVWAAMPSSGGVAPSTQAVESVTIPDVGTVRFATGAAASSSGGASGGFIPATAQALLSFYRLEVC